MIDDNDDDNDNDDNDDNVDRLAGESASDHLAQANVMAAWDGLNSRGGQAKTYGLHVRSFGQF